MKIKQNAIHTNGYTTTWKYSKCTVCTQSYYSRCSDCNNSHSRSSHSRSYYGGCYPVDGGCDGPIFNYYGHWYANVAARCSDSGCDHSSYSHSRSYYTACSQSNATWNSNTQQGSAAHTNTFNKSPDISGSNAVPAGPKKVSAITINMGAISYSDDDTDGTATTADKWELYYRRKPTVDANYSAWVLIDTNIAGNSYQWDVSTLQTGYYQVLALAYDGGTWSALMNSTGTSLSAHQIEKFQSGSSGAAQGSANGAIHYTLVSGGYVDTNDTVKYAISNEFSIFRYTAPEWLTDPWEMETTNQLQEEINKARDAYNMSSFVFTNSEIVENFNFVAKEDIDEMITAVNQIQEKSNAVSYNSTKNSTIVDDDPILAMQNLLNELS